MKNLETRSFDLKEFNQETRTIRGIAVPFNETIDVGGYSERFVRGCFGQPDDVKLFTEHRSPIGKVIELRESEAGLEVVARISDTPTGNEVYTLLKDGVLNRLSVGFIPLEHRQEGEVFVRTKVDVKEVSVVAFPAYSNATINEVRNEPSTNEPTNESKNNTKELSSMDTKTKSEEGEQNESVILDEVRTSVEELERRFAVLGTKSDEAQEGACRYRSAGEWMKAFFAGESDAKELVTRSDTGDTHVTPAFVDERLRRRLDKRIVINAFDSGPLPNDGMSIEYPFISSETGDVGEQANEGDVLDLLSLVTDTATAAVKTYGGYTNVSKQIVDRAPTSYLNSVFEMMVNSYAKATEAAARAALVGLVGANTATLAADDATSWIDLVIDAAGEIEDNGNGEAEFAIASRDVFKRLAHIVDSSGRPLFTVSGQSVNALGSTDIVVPRANIGGLQVLVDSSLAADTFIVADSNALKTYESSGAPFELTDENVTALTKDWSLYGYMAVTTPHVANVTVCDVDLVA